MGYFKDVYYEIKRGVPENTARKLVAKERYGATKEERDNASRQLDRAAQLAQWNRKLDSMF